MMLSNLSKIALLVIATFLCHLDRQTADPEPHIHHFLGFNGE